MYEFNRLRGGIDIDSQELRADLVMYALLSDFSDGVKTYLKQENISQNELARRLNVSKSAVSRMLRDDMNISIKAMSNVLAALNLDTSRLVLRSNEPFDKR